MDNIKKLKKEVGRVCSHFACRNDCSREESCIAIERDLKMWIDENLTKHNIRKIQSPKEKWQKELDRLMGE
jgi:hypothetical protein